MKHPQTTSWKDYLVILLVFALTGTTASIVPKYLLPLVGMHPGPWYYYLVYFLIITPIYMVLLMCYAWLFGKFTYFYEKQRKLLRWIGLIGPRQS